MDWSWLFGTSPQVIQAQNYQPGQQNVLNQLIGQLGGGQTGNNYQGAQDYLSKLLNRDPGTYDRFAAPLMQQFEQQTIPRIGEKFAGYGGGLGGGTGSSSGFGQAIGGATAQYGADIQSLFANLQQNAAGQSMNQYNSLLGNALGARPFQNLYQQRVPGFLENLGVGAVSGLGKPGGSSLMELIMGALGKQNQRSGIDQQPTSAGPYSGGMTYNPYSDQMGY